MKYIQRMILLMLIYALFINSSVMGVTFFVTNTNDVGPGSLRDAMTQANLSPGNDVINFNIPGTGPFFIFPASQLPALTDPTGVSIDGTTQPGTVVGYPPSSMTLMIEIDGANAGPAIGLWVQSDNNVIVGLCVSNFEMDGIRIEGGIANPSANNNLVEYCFVGTDVSGLNPKGNGRNQMALWAGVAIQNVADGIAMFNFVSQSLVSANYAEGVHVTGPIQPGQVEQNIIDMCYIGTDMQGITDLGNIHEGVCLSEGTILNTVSNNLISGNDYDGVGIQGYDNEQFAAPPIQTNDNNIVENIIGLDVALNPLGNSMHGVAIGEYGPSQWGCAAHNYVVSNIIAFNGTDGVAVWEHPIDPVNADSNLISLNRIYLNNNLGIDLNNDNVTPNDIGDPDEGPNIYLNYPVIVSALFVGGTTTISGYIDIDSDPTLAIVEVFHAANPDPSGFGEGDVYLGNCIPDALGNWSFSTASLAVGDVVTATTIDLNNNTSEFSAQATVTDQQQTEACCYPDGTCSDETISNCQNLGGIPQGAGTVCLGDNSGNGIDDVCEVLDTVICEPQTGNNPTHPVTYWYDVTPGDINGRCDFHVLVFDSIAGNYSNWIEPAGWQHAVHKVGPDWWVSWWDPTCTNAIFNTFRFQFDNANSSIWSDWSTTMSGTNDPNNLFVDQSFNHIGQPDGYGYRVHVPFDEQEVDSCDYYKSPYEDYAPNGMPDFDQKQSSWIAPGTGMYSHCGPVALANCFWWFDSKFETNTIPPPTVIDNYPLVSSFGGPPWDDHDPNNVIPFVDSLALYCNTNPAGQSGTNVFDLATGASNWLGSVGLLNDYSVNVWPVDGAVFDFDSIRTEVLESQDVILLLGFWEEFPAGSDVCERIGGHYVTVAGTCTDQVDSALCISDPFFDMHEGEPPAGSAHASSVHNDASNISGPHGTIYHDKYFVQPVTCQSPTGPLFQLELVNYPAGPAEAGVFFGQNSYDPAIPPVPPQGGIVHTVIEWAVVICPVTDTCSSQTPGDADNNGSIDIADIVYLISFVNGTGPAPSPLANGDPNGDCEINYGDALYLQNFFSGGPAPVNCTCVNPVTGPAACCYNIRGNVDFDPTDGIDIADLVYFVNYSFSGGPIPPCFDEADVDATLGLDIADIVYLVAYMFSGGPAPLVCP